MPDINYNIPFPGYGTLRANPQMPDYASYMNQLLGLNKQQPGPYDPNRPITPLNIANNFNRLQTSAPYVNLPNSRSQGPQYTMQSKRVFGELNYPWIETSQAAHGVLDFMAQSRLNKEAKQYERIQNNPLYQLPFNPNTSQQALYGIPQMSKGGPSGNQLSDVSDYLSYSLAHGNDDYSRLMLNNVRKQIGDSDAQDLMTSIMMYNQRPEIKGYNSQQRIEGFFNLKSNNDNIENLKQKLRTFDYGPLSSYRDSPEVNVLADQNKGLLVKQAEGGSIDLDNVDFGDMDEDDILDLKDDIEKYNQLKDKELSQQVPTPKEEVKQPEEKQDTTQEDTYVPDRSWQQFFNVQPINDEVDEDLSSVPIQNNVQKAPAYFPDMSGHPLLQSFKNGISNAEGANYFTGNKYSSAFGKYQFLKGTREDIRERYFPNINQTDFENAYKQDPKFQERVMDVYGSHLLSQYGGDVHKAAIAYFLGPGGVSHVNQPSYRPTPNNSTVGQYLGQFDKGYGSQRMGGHIMNKPEQIDLNFKEGGTYDLSEDQIKQLESKGYKIDRL